MGASLIFLQYLLTGGTPFLEMGSGDLKVYPCSREAFVCCVSLGSYLSISEAKFYHI